MTINRILSNLSIHNTGDLRLLPMYLKQTFHLLFEPPIITPTTCWETTETLWTLWLHTYYLGPYTPY